jgi:hypothetical protein
MRFDPSEKKEERAARDLAAKQKTEKITRIVALVLAFVSTYFFIIKIVFL